VKGRATAFEKTLRESARLLNMRVSSVIVAAVVYSVINPAPHAYEQVRLSVARMLSFDPKRFRRKGYV